MYKSHVYNTNPLLQYVWSLLFLLCVHQKICRLQMSNAGNSAFFITTQS
ncbi:unnamed protein product [Brassica rapa subsp. narinosa]